jgi:uncharacterized integral membrane protein
VKRLVGILGVVVVLALSMAFAALNGGQRVTLRLGLMTFYGVPLTAIVFGSVILGMLVMLVAGIRSDLRVRRILRDRLAREDEEERARIYVDHTQQDLFDQPEQERAPPAARREPLQPPGEKPSRPSLEESEGGPPEQPIDVPGYEPGTLPGDELREEPRDEPHGPPREEPIEPEDRPSGPVRSGPGPEEGPPPDP